MTPMIVVLIATSASFGIAGDRAVDKSTADPVVKVANIEKPPSNVVAESLGVMESSVWTVEIRNTGGQCVDVSDFRVATGTRLKLVRGSFDLPPDELALIVANEDLPVDDEARNVYANLYLAVTADGSVATIEVDTFALTDGAGRVLGDGGTTSVDLLGGCQTPAGCMILNHYKCCCPPWTIGSAWTASVYDCCDTSCNTCGSCP